MLGIGLHAQPELKGCYNFLIFFFFNFSFFFPGAWNHSGIILGIGLVDPIDVVRTRPLCTPSAFPAQSLPSSKAVVIREGER